MTSVCITGIGGYIGLATAYKLAEAGYKVVGIGSMEKCPEILPPGAVYAGIDIRDAESLTKFFSDNKVSAVYHFAGIKYVGRCESDPETCLGINTGGTEAVLKAMEKASVSHIVYASTYAVYDLSGDELVLSESSPTKPATVYGKSKLQSEALIAEASTAGQIKQYHILRYGNIVGAVPELIKHTPQNFLDTIVLSTETGDTISINGDAYKTTDGSVAKDFVDVQDVALLHLSLLTSTISAVYNVSSGVATTLKQLVALAEKVSGKKIHLVINNRTGNEPSSITIDHSSITTDLGFKPVYTLEDTVTLLHRILTT